MKLVIAEKPSVAQSIAKVIGATEKKDGYLQGGDFLVSWCVGHLIELAEPQDYDKKYEKWKKDDLPIFPDPYQYRISSETSPSDRCHGLPLDAVLLHVVTNRLVSSGVGSHTG